MVIYARGNDAGSRELIVFHDDLGPPALARAEDDGGSRAVGTRGCATAMSVVLKTKFAPAQFCPEKKNRGHRDHAQGCNLLPIHNAKIAVCGVRATGCFQWPPSTGTTGVPFTCTFAVILLAKSMSRLLKFIEYRSTALNSCGTKFIKLSQICRQNHCLPGAPISWPAATFASAPIRNAGPRRPTWKVFSPRHFRAKAGAWSVLTRLIPPKTMVSSIRRKWAWRFSSTLILARR
jgi:hypothetical protein